MNLRKGSEMQAVVCLPRSGFVQQLAEEISRSKTAYELELIKKEYLFVMHLSD